ncbi:MAG: bifunctional riboflavin kinase/FAD synthetase [Pseudomonadota bacterium]
MRIVRDYQFAAPEDRAASVAIGNFDGVHLGHQAVLELARDWATNHSKPLGILTFEPHPREFFLPDARPFRLMAASTRAHRLEKLGVEVLFELHFSRALSDMTAAEFAEKVLARGLDLSHLVVGRDFRFGKDRAGDADTLQELGAKLGFEVTIADLIQSDRREVSSTNIRAALDEGRPRDAAAMLGHWHRIEGTVVHGDARGRELGYPTANMALKGLHLPAFGVYAVKVDVLTGSHAGSYLGASSLGVRPQFDGEVPNLETFIFDFNGDLYGSDLSVGLVEFLRPEAKFDSIEALITQMESDCVSARGILAEVEA